MSATDSMTAAVEACRAEGLDPSKVLRGILYPKAVRATFAPVWFRVLEFLSGSEASTRTASEALGVPYQSAYKEVKNLAAKGWIREVGLVQERTKGPLATRYAVTDAGRAEIARYKP